MSLYLVRLSDVDTSYEFSSAKGALSFARKAKDDHGGAVVYLMTPQGPVCLHSWTVGEDGKVRKVVVR